MSVSYDINGCGRLKKASRNHPDVFTVIERLNGYIRTEWGSVNYDEKSGMLKIAFGGTVTTSTPAAFEALLLQLDPHFLSGAHFEAEAGSAEAGSERYEFYLGPNQTTARSKNILLYISNGLFPLMTERDRSNLARKLAGKRKLTNRVVVEIEGDAVAGIHSGRKCEVLVIDRDVEGGTAENVRTVLGQDGCTTICSARVNAGLVQRAFRESSSREPRKAAKGRRPKKHA